MKGLMIPTRERLRGIAISGLFDVALDGISANLSFLTTPIILISHAKTVTVV
jgi:hypothetical protein